MDSFKKNLQGKINKILEFFRYLRGAGSERKKDKKAYSFVRLDFTTVNVDAP